MTNNQYTEEEKKTFINFFIKEGPYCKVEMRKYLESVILKYGQKVHNNYPTRKIKSPIDEMNNYEYEVPPFFWGNENNDNLLIYVFSNPKFIPTPVKIKKLKQLKVDFNHINNKGENFLFYMRIERLEETKELIKDMNVKTDLLSTDGDVFYSHIFKNYKSTSKDYPDCKLEEVRIIEVMNFIAQNNSLMKLIEKEKIEELRESFHQCIEIMERKVFELLGPNMTAMNYAYDNYEKAKENNQLPYARHKEFMDKIFNYHLLEKKLSIDSPKDKIKKPKI